MSFFQILAFIIIVSVANITNASPYINMNELENPVKDSEGFYLKVTKSQAQRYCDKLNKRLPKLEEWVQYAVLNGARGFVDREDERNLLSQTYHTVNKTYIYSEIKYKPTTLIRTAWWIEDEGSSFYTPPRGGAFSFDRSNGLIYTEDPNRLIAFVCVSH